MLLSKRITVGPISVIQLPPVRLTARTQPGYSNFISLSEVKSLKLELLPLDGTYEEKQKCTIGGMEYKAEAKVMIDIRQLGSSRQSTQKFFVIRSSTAGVLLDHQGLTAINDIVVNNNKARASFVGSINAPPPHKALLVSPVSLFLCLFFFGTCSLSEKIHSNLSKRWMLLFCHRQ